ncbi:MAG TPA: contractile injection system tape measure protein [Myxococcaceae bacterium]|jgi:hypothetical protein
MHRIDRVEIELEAGDLGVARELSELAGRMRERRIAPILDRVCGDLSDGDALDRIERLEVDLGSVSAERFEEDFASRLEPALRAALLAALRRQGARRDRAVEAALELLETFALTGNLPWWAEARERDVVARHFARVAGEAREALASLVRRIAVDPVALDRVARAAGAGTLLALASPGRVDEGAPVELPMARRRELLLALASDEPVPPPGVRGGRAAAGSGSTGSGAESRLTSPPPVVEGQVAAAPGASPAPALPADARRPNEPSRDPVVSGAPPPVLAGEVPAAKALVPDGPVMEPPAVEPMAADQRAAEALPTTPALVPGSDPARPPVVPAAPRSPVPEGARRLVPPAALAARRAALARLDEIYVDDAGLVILWPFLERFFVRIGLVQEEERRFLGEGAAIQAVALLEALVTADPEPLELRVPLPKLLCGRELESGFALERPLAPEQLAEGDLLLTAAIDRARVLGELSIAGFRTTFLQRRGALSTRNGAWLLQVERQAPDALLDRFPWSWSWVKLPWMPDPLQVEW